MKINQNDARAVDRFLLGRQGLIVVFLPQPRPQSPRGSSALVARADLVLDWNPISKTFDVVKDREGE